MCCGGGSQKPFPQNEPHVDCDGVRVEFRPDAWVIAQKFGLSLCSITGTGKDGLVLRQDVDRALGR